MDHSFPVSPFHLAQMPTDQREVKHHPLVQTGPPDDGMFQVKPLHPYSPCSPTEHWAAFRSAPQSMNSYPHPGYSDIWHASVSETYNPSSRMVPNCRPDSTYFSPAYTGTYSVPPTMVSAALPVMISSPSAMGPGSPTILKQEEPDKSFDWPANSCTPDWMRPQPSHTGYQRDQRVKLEDSDSRVFIKSTPRPSPSPISISSYYSSPQPHTESSPTTMNVNSQNSASPHTVSDDGVSEDDNNIHTPYSQLIYQALMEQDDKRLPLQKIYEWFEINTKKGSDQSQRGWQNSIRHNLSMNAGFIAIRNESPEVKRTVNYWCLTEDAIENGIQSTTRYRRDTKGRKTPNTTVSSIPNRQESNRKGDISEKNPGTCKTRSLIQDDRLRLINKRPTEIQSTHLQTRQFIDNGPCPHGLPTMHNAVPWPSNNGTYIQTFSYNDVLGCATPPRMPNQMHHYSGHQGLDAPTYYQPGWN